MNSLSKYGTVAGITAIFLVLVIIRLTGNNFRPDAVKWAEPSFDRSNIISTSQSIPAGDILLINLGQGSADYINASENINIDPSDILEAENIRMIRKHKGPVILHSSEQSVSARVWMTLSQMGIRELFITGSENETLRNQIRPDSSSLTR